MRMFYAIFMMLAPINLIAGGVNNKFENIPAGEAEKIKVLTSIIEKSISKNRDAHAKAHGCFEGATVKVREDLPENLRVGFFAKPGKKYSALVRSSSGSGDVKVNDHDGGGQGFALKMFLDQEDAKSLMTVFGEDQSFVDKKYYQTFDILTISRSSEFFVDNVDDYFVFFAAQGQSAKVFAQAKMDGRTDEEAKALSAKAFQEAFIFPKEGKQRLREGAVLGKLASARTKNPLAETYFSFVPSLYGDNAVKYKISPCSPADPEKYEFAEELGDWKNNKNFLREVLKYELRQKDHCFKLSIQLHKEGFPSVEEAVAPWSEAMSPYVEIATIQVAKKAAGSEIISDEICENASFHPGHSSKEHFPIGGIQRARVGGVDAAGKDYEGIYTVIARERNKRSKSK